MLKTSVYAGMMMNEIRKITLLNFLTQILYLLCYIFSRQIENECKGGQCNGFYK